MKNIRKSTGTEITLDEQKDTGRAYCFIVTKTLLTFATSQFLKCGGNSEHLACPDVALISADWSKRLLVLDAALNKLDAEDERKIQMVELRYFCRYSVKEVAEILKISGSYSRSRLGTSSCFW